MPIIRPTAADISLDNVFHNTQVFRSLLASRTELMAVVKADAYGHGAVEVASTALAAGATSLGVAIVEEAVELRRAGIGAPILILGHTPAEAALQVAKLGLTATVFDREVAQALSVAATRLGRKVRVHIKVDTGMGRLGVRPGEVLPFVENISNLPSLLVEGVFTHFASADSVDLASARAQLATFNTVCSRLEAKGWRLQRHAANTAAILALPDSHLDMVRLGIGLYGLFPAQHLKSLVALKPVMSLRSRLSYVKWVEDGTPIGYGGAYVAEGQRLIATVPIGYADGYSRRLSGVGRAILHGQEVPLVGRVCMDQCMFDITASLAEAGDEVVLMGAQGALEISADDLALAMGTINYEVCCLINRRVPRLYWRHNKLASLRTLLGRG
ncbi:MAG: alanine racemase [Peptococcaceae bacterium]|nr:alanine racemase [Peptococcaceae bacterium]